MNITGIDRNGIVIAGGGLAGQRCAETLRRSGYAGPIRIVCGEPWQPYDRPPLSKELLSGERDEHSLQFRDAGWYEKSDIELVIGARAAGLSLDERTVLLSDGARLRYDRLLIATGSRPRTLPMLAGHPNVSVLRTVDDALALREVLSRSDSLIVVGAGFIGQEVAATARKLGLDVTIIEAASTPLEPILGARLGSWFAALHRAEGVRVLTGATIVDAASNGRLNAVQLSDGSRLAVEHVVVGVGVAPDTDWLAGTPLHTDVGIPVDDRGRTAVPGVFAAGDVAATLDPRTGRHLPGSHWEAAARQGARAARAMLGLDPGDQPPSSFWSDQYGIRIQYLGQARGADEVQIDGDPDARDFTATFLTAGRPVAALLVNRPRSLPAARALIEKGKQ